MKAAICACAPILVVVATVADQTDLKSLYDQHRWFELRDAIHAPPLPVGDDFHHGHLGLDALRQAREVCLDFASRSLELLP